VHAPIALSYSIDAADCIEAVNESWTRFATANGGESVLPSNVVGSSLWRWISDASTRQVYKTLLKNARSGAPLVRFRFRCDAPRERRLLEMHISANRDASVDFETRLILSQPRDDVRLIAADAPRTDALISVCGWCMRVQVSPGQWIEVDRAVVMLELFQSERLPAITHGMCPECYDTMMAAADDEGIIASGKVTVGDFSTAS
jgi:hypothetical protein